MKPTGYGIYRNIPLAYDEAVRQVTEALKMEGFGVLTEIDVKATLNKKLGVTDFPRYIILGACNPQLAHKALTAEPGIGLLLPCNVVVQENPDGTSTLAALDAEVIFGKLVEAPGVGPIAQDAKARLTRALDAVAKAK